MNVHESELISYLRMEGKEIGRKAESGNDLCKQIINMYAMWHKSPRDPGSFGILQGLLEKYKDMNKKNGFQQN